MFRRRYRPLVFRRRRLKNFRCSLLRNIQSPPFLRDIDQPLVPGSYQPNLQEAIVGSTLMYGSEVTWRGQRLLRDAVQRSINRMSRASLGVLRSTPVSFLQSFGGRMPAEPRLNQRQAAFAARTVCSAYPSTRQKQTTVQRPVNDCYSSPKPRRE